MKRIDTHRIKMLGLGEASEATRSLQNSVPACASLLGYDWLAGEELHIYYDLQCGFVAASKQRWRDTPATLHCGIVKSYHSAQDIADMVADAVISYRKKLQVQLAQMEMLMI